MKAEYLLDKGQPAITIPKPPPLEDPQSASRSFFTTVAGVTFEGRQKIVARCKVGESLTLVRDPENRFDTGAIRILRSNGEQLGFVPADVSRGGHSSGLAFRMDRGDKYQCRISALTGGGDKNLGVNIEIAECDDKGNAEFSSAANATGASTTGGWQWLIVVVAVAVLLLALVSIYR